MIAASLVASVVLIYISLLFGIAYYADRRRDHGRSLISNPNIYALSLAVYFTSWTFYGSVGRAATSGLDFLPVYLGPTLIAFSWWFIVRKLVRISKEHKIVSIADFISSRYGKSVSLGAIVTLFAVIGIMPYIALQLKAVSQTFDILTLPPEQFEHGIRHYLPNLTTSIDTALIAAILLSLFGILFGTRHLDATERHEGLVAAIAVESLVKVAAFLAVGLFVTFGLFDGPADIFTRFATRFPERKDLLLLDTAQIAYPTWFSLTFISMMAIMFLPRQFHIMVIENSAEEHIRHAMWRFPAYMFLLNLFVLPIALAGLLYNNGDVTLADYYVLQLPLQTGHPWLALLVYVGGFSAAAGMVMVESVTLSTMILNHLIIPVMLRFGLANRDLAQILLNLKRLGIVAVIGLGYVYYRMIGDSFALVNIGLISFIAATQFAPSMLGALYWKRANRFGVTTGLVLGFVVWFYTLLVPSFVRSGWFFSPSILTEGPFQLGFLRPLELFGLSGFDMWTHALFWTMFFNVGAFLTLSLLTRPKSVELEQANKFVDVFFPQRQQEPLTRISKAPTVVEFVELMSKFIGAKPAAQAISDYLGDHEIDARGSLSEYELPNLKRFTERTLAGSVGAAPARIIVDNYLAARGSHMEDVFDIFGSVTISRTSSRERLGVLYEVARIVGAGTNLQSILDDILAMLCQQFKLDLCVVRFHNRERHALVVGSRQGEISTLSEEERALSEDSYLSHAFLNNIIMVVNDVDQMEHPALASLVRAQGITAFAHAPVTLEGEPIGILSAYSRSTRGNFTDEFVELLQSVAAQIGIAWRNARLTDELLVAREQEKELEIAKTIQLGLLPQEIPAIPGVTLAGLCVPAKQVGGDYYDCLSSDSNQLDLVVADVSGHNIGAALLMAETRAFIRAKAQSLQSTADILGAVNSFFHHDLNRSDMFITMFYSRYDATTRVLTYASAGHNPPLLWRNAQKHCERLDADGLILGIRTEVVFEERQLALEPGDMLLCYTDGLIEAENSSEDFFGEQRLEQLLKEYCDFEPQVVIDRIMEQARLFTGVRTFRDDVTMVVLKVHDSGLAS